MRSLCDAMLGRAEVPQDNFDDFDMERVLETQAEEQLEQDAIAEIDRYRRMDEWSSSYQNVYSRAALRCQRQLMQANLLEFDYMQFLPYTRAGTYDLLRLDAFECLVDMNIFGSIELLKWFIFTMSSDSSAWLRCRLHNAFGRALGPIAFGRRPTNEPPAQNDGLIIEQESSTEVRQADLARRQTVPGAMEGLRSELSGDQILKESLWAACNSPCIGLLELSEFTDLCRVLYEPITSLRVALRYPRYWKVKNLGKVSDRGPPSSGISSWILTLFAGTLALLQIRPCSNSSHERRCIRPRKTQARGPGNATSRPSHYIQADQSWLGDSIRDLHVNPAAQTEITHPQDVLFSRSSYTGHTGHTVNPSHYSRRRVEVEAENRAKAEIINLIRVPTAVLFPFISVSYILVVSFPYFSSSIS